MAYYFYLDGVLLPVTPGSLELKINNNNKTLTLIDNGEINMLKSPGLTDISFEALLPSFNYPFNNPDTQKPEVYLEKFEKLKTSKKPFVFSVSRTKPNGDYMFDNSMNVSLEEYKIEEDADKYGFDIMVSIELKQYREFKTRFLTTKTSTNGKTTAAVKKSRTTSKTIAKTYTVKKGDTLWGIAKKQLNDGSKYKELAKLNGISNPNKLKVGQVIKLG